LQDPARVADDLVVIDQDRDVGLLGQLHDLGSLRAAPRDPLGSVLEAELVEPTGDRAAGAEEVRWGAAAIEDSAWLAHQVGSLIR
jgi:hypothetical protein